MDITHLILDDHAEQRRLFSFLDELDHSDVAALTSLWRRLPGVAVVAVATHPIGSKEWFLAVAATNAADGDHMAGEEREGLADCRLHAGLQDRHALARPFAVSEADHITDVAAVDRALAAYIDPHR